MEFWTRTIIANSGALLEGLQLTLSVSVIAFVIAAVAGLAICLARIYVQPLRPVLSAYVAFCRNTPIFVQLLWVAYAWYDIFAWPKDVFTAAWVALALQSSGYLAETFRVGLDSVPQGHLEAAYALGIRRFTVLRRIVAPQMLLTIAPSLTNQFIVIIKCSTLVSVIAVPDLMFQAIRLTNIWGEPVPILTFVAAVYVALIISLSALAKRLTGRVPARMASERITGNTVASHGSL
jgi:polar amino acid transport system permease protein